MSATNGDDPTEGRKPGARRAQQRNPVTEVDPLIGNALRDLRRAAGMSQRDVGLGMVLPSGEHHPAVAQPLHVLATSGTDSTLRKAVQRIEAHTKAILVSELVAYCTALGIQPARALEAAGLSAPSISVDSAILGDAGLRAEHKQTLIQLLRALRSAQ